MRIGIDGRFLTHPQAGGFKTYTEELVSGLAAVDPDNEYVLYLDRAPGAATRLPHAANFRHVVVTSRWPIVGMVVREQLALARCIDRDRLDVLHEPCQTAPLRLSCPLVVTLHDTIWLDPELARGRGVARSARRRLMAGYQRVVGRRVAARASIVVTVSEASRRRIVARLPVSPDRVVVTHEAARPMFRRLDDDARVRHVRESRGLRGAFLLALGSGDPRKNIAALIDAFVPVRAAVPACTLAVVSNYPPLARELAGRVSALGLASAVRFLTNVTNEELVALYSCAEAFVHPSLEEGFGLPLLEAMACGAPVIAFDNSSIPEVAGDAAMLVPTGSIEALSQRIVEVLGDAGLRQRLAARGLERAAQFSWERCARETIAAYVRAVGGGARA